MSFSQKVAEDLLVQAARCCCLCRQYKGTKIEVHHIAQQADGGSDEPENGIPLCFDCHAEVESYNTKHPRGRKFQPSELKRLRDEWFGLVASGKVPSVAVFQDEDTQLIRFYSQCFDRPAFQDYFQQEGSMEAFDKAIEDTITAINTGCLLSRDGKTLAMARGKSYLHNPQWRDQMDVIIDILKAIRSRYKLAIQLGQIQVGHGNDSRQFYCFHDSELAEWMDMTRAEVIQLFSNICEEAGIKTLVFPRKRWRNRHY